MLSVLTLRNEKTGEHYDVLNKKTHLVARAGFDGDLEISDMSVSRRHADIFLVKKTVSGTVKLLLKVVDRRSKFGTFVNSGIDLNQQIQSDCPMVLELNDRIRFGIVDSFWIVVEYPIVVCPSTLKMADKDILRKSLTKIHGQVTRDWTEQCTHLCMNSITVTEKVLLCLMSVKSIVSVKYFIDLCQALSPGSLTELPYCVDYQPELVENILNPSSVSLDLNHKRKSLFSNKTFICSTAEQLNRISKIVKAGGGKIINYFDGVMSDNDILSCKESIVMHQDPHNTEDSDEYQLILDKLKEMNKRPIPENDIGLAIIFSSIEKHCNPYYNVSFVNLQSQSNQAKAQASVILAPETEVLTVDDSEIFSINVVPDSISHSQDHFKRPLDVVMDSEEIVTSKKRVLFLSDNEDVDENHSGKKTKVKENSKPFKRVIESIPCSSSNRAFQSVECKKTFASGTLANADSCLTVELSSQDVSKKNIYLSREQTTIEEKNVSITDDNSQPKVVNNNAATTKRKLLSICSIVNNDDADPFDYKDIDEIEEYPKKKPKKDLRESIFFPMLTTTTSDENKRSPVEPAANCTKDQNFIMNLLAEAKGIGQFIDASKLPNKSSINVSVDTKNNDLVDSVIVETVSLVISKPMQTRNIQGSHSNLRNFKKFKRKGPAMRIPHIVSLELDQM